MCWKATRRLLARAATYGTLRTGNLRVVRAFWDTHGFAVARAGIVDRCVRGIQFALVVVRRDEAATTPALTARDDHWMTDSGASSYLVLPVLAYVDPDAPSRGYAGVPIH